MPKSRANPISIEELRRQISYNPETGEFARLVPGRAIATKLQPTGYRRIGVNREYYLAHRVAWALSYGRWPHMVDHVNGIRHDNRLCNLREVTDAENCLNRRVRRDSTSGVHGVSRCPTGWRVCIGWNRRVKYIGTYRSFDEAVAVRRSIESDFGFHPNHGNGRAEYKR